MSSYWKVACRECKEAVDLSGYSDTFIVKYIGEFMRYDHIGHDVVAFSDLSDDDGRLEDSIKEYRVSPPPADADS